MLAAHAHLDGDALGAMLVSAHGLRLLGKQVVLYNPDPVPRRLRFVPGATEVIRRVPPGQTFCATLVHDCSSSLLLGEHFPPRAATGQVIVIDHHEITADFGDIVIRDPRAGSAAQVALDLLFAAGLKPDGLSADLATALFVSLVEDTGWFRYPNTTAQVFGLAQLALSYGVDPWDISLRLDEQLTEASLRLRALVLQTLERHCNGKLALLSLTDEMLRAAQATPDDIGKFVNYARAVGGVEIGAQITVSDRRIYVSLRSKGQVHVGLIAKQFGGGGHRNAAGCTIAFSQTVPDTLAEAKQRLVSVCEQALNSASTEPLSL